MLLRQPPRPYSCTKILQGLWLPYAIEWISQDCLDKLKRSQRRLAVCRYPVFQVLPKLWMKDGISLFFLILFFSLLRQVLSPDEAVPHCEALAFLTSLASMQIAAVEHS